MQMHNKMEIEGVHTAWCKYDRQKNRTTAAKESCAKHYVNRLPEEAQGQQMGVGAAGARSAGAWRLGRCLASGKTQKEDGTCDRRQTRRCGTSCARSARPMRSCWGSRARSWRRCACAGATAARCGCRSKPYTMRSRAMNSRRRPRARTTCSHTGSAGHDGP